MADDLLKRQTVGSKQQIVGSKQQIVGSEEETIFSEQQTVGSEQLTIGSKQLTVSSKWRSQRTMDPAGVDHGRNGAALGLTNGESAAVVYC